MTSQTGICGHEVKFAHADFERVEADGTFCGYASLFGREDLGHDIIMPGAFKKSLERQSSNGIRMLFQHDPNQPVGVWDVIREDERGLFVKGRLTLDVAKAREVHALMKDGGLNGLSIGYKTIKGKREQRSGVRRLYEVDLWEISVVTFPMLPEAQVSAVKSVGKNSAQKRLPTTREFEQWLMRDAGLSRKEARTVIRSGFKSLASRQDAAAGRDVARKDAARTIRDASRHLRAAAKTLNSKGKRT